MSIENPEQYLVPERLDEPYRFMIFTIEEAVSFFAPILLGYTFDLAWQGVCAGVFLFWSIRKLRSGDADALNYAKYWIFPDYAAGLRRTPSSSIRTFYS